MVPNQYPINNVHVNSYVYIFSIFRMQDIECTVSAAFICEIIQGKGPLLDLLVDKYLTISKCTLIYINLP